MNKPLILGLGNYLMGDEGVGVHAVQYWRHHYRHLPIPCEDGGTGGFMLTHYFTDYQPLIIIDATLNPQAPGTFHCLTPRFAADFPKAMSTHDLGLKDLVESLILLNKMPEIYLFAVSVAEIQPLQIGLSPEVEHSLPALCAAIEQLLYEKELLIRNYTNIK